jgi:hypothetical protein
MRATGYWRDCLGFEGASLASVAFLAVLNTHTRLTSAMLHSGVADNLTAEVPTVVVQPLPPEVAKVRDKIAQAHICPFRKTECSSAYMI